MKKIIHLHLGLPRTGTTSIQAYLRRNDRLCRSQGVLYPGAAEHPSFLTQSNHTIFYNAVIGKIAAPCGGLDVEGCRTIVANVIRAFVSADDLENLIWSHESLSDSARVWDVDWLTSIIGDVEVSALVYARYTDEWIESLYGQNIWRNMPPRSSRSAKAAI
jgi:hypothetical protein